ncbi:MAG: ABC transporter permease subunit [Verrucomicrobiota bacterium]|nr:ABC transporter permease subunit [Verrucomicrobiota bacterium]
MPALTALISRELHAGFLNHYLQVFSVLALGGGIGAALVATTPDAAPMFILQLALYFVSLFALLIGTSSARAESQEWPLLFAQPIPRATFLLGKFLAFSLIFAGILALFFLPTLFVRQADAGFLGLYLYTLTLAALFVALGLCAGFLARDRVQGLVLSISLWLILLFGLDLVALIAAHFSFLQRAPDIWSALLMLNPLDSFRIHTLFALERIPAETAKETALTSWWLAQSGLWFVLISILWTASSLGIAARHLAAWED